LKKKYDLFIGGDFVKLGWNSVTPKEYYAKSMQIMKDKQGVETFFIVTDDRKYASDLLNGLDFKYKFIGSNIKEDFYLIGSYKKRILSSSTFSLWASALGDNHNSIVIAPSFWAPRRKRNIFLPNEIRI